jgi:hypothetical protein
MERRKEMEDGRRVKIEWMLLVDHHRWSVHERELLG